tara:strand:+ start:1375 stop:1695 length:321 start_codon:yes stop_codon:yes gene_type:complete
MELLEYFFTAIYAFLGLLSLLFCLLLINIFTFFKKSKKAENKKPKYTKFDIEKNQKLKLRDMDFFVTVDQVTNDTVVLKNENAKYTLSKETVYSSYKPINQEDNEI